MTLPIFPRMKIKHESYKKLDWNNTIKRSGSNKVRILTGYMHPHWEIQAKVIALSDDEVLQLQGFFAGLRGNAKPFLWYDHEDNEVKNATIGISDGVTKKFYLQRYVGGHSENVLDIVQGSLTVTVNDEPVEFKEKEGEITLKQIAPQGAKVKASFKYYWRVRLVKDSLNFKHKFNNINEIDLTMEVVR